MEVNNSTEHQSGWVSSRKGSKLGTSGRAVSRTVPGNVYREEKELERANKENEVPGAW